MFLNALIAFLFFIPLLSADDFDKFLEEMRQEKKFPALAAAVTKDYKVVAKGAVGFRKSGSDIKVTLKDKFHIGSCTKSMTATLAAMLVEEKKIKWTTKLRDIFPREARKFHGDYRDITLEQLLSMTAGLPYVPKSHPKIWGGIRSKMYSLKPHQQRLFLMQEVLKLKPEYKPGEGYVYSNSSFAIAGLMLEKVSATTWEKMLIKKLATPLKITSLGYGIAGKDPKRIDQPYGHFRKDGKNTPVIPAKFVGNPPSIAPAGLVHLTVEDFATYTKFYAEKGSRLFLNKSSFIKLTEPIKNNYALGWFAVDRNWGGRVLNHNGSNTMNFAVTWIAPEKNFSIVIMTNTAGDNVAKDIDDIAGKLINKFLK